MGTKNIFKASVAAVALASGLVFASGLTAEFAMAQNSGKPTFKGIVPSPGSPALPSRPAPAAPGDEATVNQMMKQALVKMNEARKPENAGFISLQKIKEVETDLTRISEMMQKKVGWEIINETDESVRALKRDGHLAEAKSEFDKSMKKGVEGRWKVNHLENAQKQLEEAAKYSGEPLGWDKIGTTESDVKAKKVEGNLAAAREYLIEARKPQNLGNWTLKYLGDAERYLAEASKAKGAEVGWDALAKPEEIEALKQASRDILESENGRVPAEPDVPAVPEWPIPSPSGP